MNVSRSQLIILSIGIGLFLAFSVENLYAQTIQDLECTACITISNIKELEQHQNLPLPIMLWAENFDYIYDHNSILTINGFSKLNDPNTPITVSVTDPIGNLVTIEQIMVQPNSNFQVKFNTGGPLWKKDGMYIIKAQGGPQSTVFKTMVELIPTGTGTKVTCTTKQITVKADNGGTYCIPYSSTGDIQSIEPASLSSKSKSLKFEIRSLDIQTLTLNIETQLLNSKTSTGASSPFNVLLNGNPANFDEQESTLPNYRTLSISIPRDTVTIEVVGTHVIPEFGSIAVLILVVAVISGVALSSKKLRPQLNLNN